MCKNILWSMKLTGVWVSGFKSFKEKTRDQKMPFLVNEKITILIGANDHGKSNLLEAIEHLNDDKQITEAERNWDLPNDKQPRIEWTFTLDKDELGLLEKETVPIPILSLPPVTEPLSQGEQAPSTEISVSEISTFFTESEEKNELVYFKEGIDNPIKVLSTPFKIETRHEKLLLDMRPRIEFFKAPKEDALVDEINKNQLDDPNSANYDFIKGIFVTGGFWETRSRLFGGNNSTRRQLKKASEALTKALQEKWQQSGEVWNLMQSSNPDVLTLDIDDNSVKERTVSPSSKSSGFRTFFQLSMMITSRIQQSENKPLIFLFDEPGIYLHPRAQIDLQRSFERQAEKNTQLIYTTHSPFLVSKNYPGRNRVISRTLEGTVIDQKPFQGNWKSVRDSLGIIMSNTFLIAEKSILVEGPSDAIYLYNAVRKLKRFGIDIDLNDFNVVDGGDSENYLAMTKLLIEEGRLILGMIDGDDGGKRILKDITKVESDEELKRNKYKEEHPSENIPKYPKIIPFPLIDGKSTEDVFVDKDLLLEAIRNVTKDLLRIGTRVQVENFDLDNGIEIIRKKTGETLGKIIKDETENWFVPKRELSKLSIALEYDNLAQNSEYKPTKIAIQSVEKIKELLDLKGEASAEEGILIDIEESAE